MQLRVNRVTWGEGTLPDALVMFLVALLATARDRHPDLQFVHAVGVKGGAVASIELGRVFHHHDGRFDGVDCRTAALQHAPAGAQGFGEVAAGLGPVGLADV
jgi:hypothetical protein